MTTNFILAGLFILSACSKAPDITKKRQFAPKPIMEPAAYEFLSQEDVRNFMTLPMTGDVRDQKRFWSGDFWRSQKGSINRRWNAQIRIGFNHRSPTLDELRLLTPEKIAELAPSEKYDLLMGYYDYPLRKEVSQLGANENAEMWEGMSNGWAVASVRHGEPQAKILTNPDGIQISFGPEDIKGLLAYYYSYHHAPAAASLVGRPCQKLGCPEDVTAATFHLALANSLGVHKKPFLMDLDRTRDVWNHPVVAFESEYRGNAELHEKMTPGTHSVIRMKTTVTYIDEALSMTWAPVLGTTNQLETKQLYLYWLHLDREGNVIGGEWKSNERPDYLWTVSDATQFEGILYRLQELIDDPKSSIADTEEQTIKPINIE